MRWQSLSQQAIKARAAFNHCHWQQWKHPRANNYILYWYMYIINMYVRCVYMYSAMHIVLDIQRGSSQCATLFICATSIYGSWIRETKRIQKRIRISIRVRNSTSTATDLGATGGNSNNCAAIYAIQFVRWPQTLTKFFDLQNYFYDVAGNDFWYHFRQLPSPPPPLLPSFPIWSELKLFAYALLTHIHQIQPHLTKRDDDNDDGDAHV